MGRPGSARAQAIEQRIAGDETAGSERESDHPQVAQALDAAGQGEARDAEPDQQDGDLTRPAELLAEKHHRYRRHDQRRDAPRQRIDVAEIAGTIGLDQEQHITDAQERACDQIGPGFGCRDRHEGKQQQRHGRLCHHHDLHEGKAIAVGLDQGIPGRVHQRRAEHHQEDLDRHGGSGIRGGKPREPRGR